jgi:hypothetical protein
MGCHLSLVIRDRVEAFDDGFECVEVSGEGFEPSILHAHAPLLGKIKVEGDAEKATGDEGVAAFSGPEKAQVQAGWAGVVGWGNVLPDADLSLVGQYTDIQQRRRLVLASRRVESEVSDALVCKGANMGGGGCRGSCSGQHRVFFLWKLRWCIKNVRPKLASLFQGRRVLLAVAAHGVVVDCLTNPVKRWAKISDFLKERGRLLQIAEELVKSSRIEVLQVEGFGEGGALLE